MKAKFTTQDMIDMASDLYDNKGMSRLDIHIFLTAERDCGLWDASDETIERVFDLIVG